MNLPCRSQQSLSPNAEMEARLSRCACPCKLLPCWTPHLSTTEKAVMRKNNCKPCAMSPRPCILNPVSPSTCPSALQATRCRDRTPTAGSSVALLDGASEVVSSAASDPASLLLRTLRLQDLLRITASWLQTNSDTGRISVENPNMQCVPKPRRFSVPTTQRDGSRIFEANLRQVLGAQYPFLLPH